MRFTTSPRRRMLTALAGLGMLASIVGTGSATAVPNTGSGAAPGQCAGPDIARVCVDTDSTRGTIEYWSYTSYPNGDRCNLVLQLMDGDWPVFTTPFACGTNFTSHTPGGLANPAAGHSYHAELQVHWSDGRVDHYASPSVTFN
ncbi:hypothetical protein AB0N05_01290 [Nocardia sp. NPDC051030]|uniref:hypothetical protein n=1 Tax=Nocardia sp. NPDC051030 TaxID=3155162 RepID=UPI003442BE22